MSGEAESFPPRVPLLDTGPSSSGRDNKNRFARLRGHNRRWWVKRIGAVAGLALAVGVTGGVETKLFDRARDKAIANGSLLIQANRAPAHDIKCLERPVVLRSGFAESSTYPSINRKILFVHSESTTSTVPQGSEDYIRQAWIVNELGDTVLKFRPITIDDILHHKPITHVEDRGFISAEQVEGQLTTASLARLTPDSIAKLGATGHCAITNSGYISMLDHNGHPSSTPASLGLRMQAGFSVAFPFMENGALPPVYIDASGKVSDSPDGTS